jgi:hypothetical protein
LVGLAPESALAKRRCVPCAFGGLCGKSREQCGPSAARCVPRRGILAFNSEPAAPYSYWTFFAERRPGPRGHLRGRLAVHADAGVPSPAVPGFPGQCDAEVCLGQEAELEGVVVRDRLTAIARYADGAVCDFDLDLLFGFGRPQAPNRFVCRDAGGAVLAEGGLRLQLIRLFGCRTRQ